MAWLRVTGMIPPEPGSYWSEGTLTVEPAYREHLDWSDGGRRAAWPITGTLAGAGTRWASTRDYGDVLIPGADVGVSVEPPVVELTVRLRDGVTGEWKTSRLVGIVEATAPGEWNINAPLKNTLRHVETPGVPAGALRTTDVGVVVPSMAEFGGLGGRVGLLEQHIRLVSRVVAPTYTVERWSDGVQRVWGWERGGPMPPNNWTILQWPLPMPFVDQAFYVEARITEGIGFLGHAVFETAEVQPLDAGHAIARAKHNFVKELYYTIHYHAVGRWF